MRTHYENAAGILGYISLLIVATGVLFRLMHWPGGAAILILGCSFTAFPFLLLLGITKAMSYPHKIGKVFIVISTFFAMSSMMGIIFKLMRWPGAGAMLMFGMFLGPIVAYLPLLIIDIKKSNTKSFFKPGLQFASLTLVCLAFAIWGTSTSPDLLKSSEATALAENNVNETLNELVNSKKIGEESRQILDLIRESKIEIIENTGVENAEEMLKDISDSRGKYDSQVVYRAMQSNANGYDISRQEKLQELYFEIEKKWSENTGSKRFHIEVVKYNSRNKYPLFNFNGVPLVYAFAQLEAIEQSVLAMQIELHQ